MSRFSACAPAKGALFDWSEVKKPDVELWAIRLPPGFDASRLGGHTLRGDDGAACSSSDDGGFTLRPIPVCEAEGLLGAFPSAKKQRWIAGKPITRQFAVTVPPGPLPPPAAHIADLGRPLPPVPPVPGLRLRQPFAGASMAGVPSAPRDAAGESGEPMRKKRKRAAAEEAAEAACAAGGEAATSASPHAGETAEERSARKAAKRARKAAKEAQRRQ